MLRTWVISTPPAQLYIVRVIVLSNLNRKWCGYLDERRFDLLDECVCFGQMSSSLFVAVTTSCQRQFARAAERTK